MSVEQSRIPSTISVLERLKSLKLEPTTENKRFIGTFKRALKKVAEDPEIEISFPVPNSSDIVAALTEGGLLSIYTPGLGRERWQTTQEIPGTPFFMVTTAIAGAPINNVYSGPNKVDRSVVSRNGLPNGIRGRLKTRTI